jgi:hypothetical protein
MGCVEYTLFVFSDNEFTKSIVLPLDFQRFSPLNFFCFDFLLLFTNAGLKSCTLGLADFFIQILKSIGGSGFHLDFCVESVQYDIFH